MYPNPNILLSKSHENPSKYVNTVTNCAYLNNLRSMTSDDCYTTFEFGSHVYPYPNIILPSAMKNDQSMWEEWTTLQGLSFFSTQHIKHTRLCIGMCVKYDYEMSTVESTFFANRTASRDKKRSAVPID